MLGLGTIINSASIAAGGVIGHFTGKLFKPQQQESLNKACGVSVLACTFDIADYDRNRRCIRFFDWFCFDFLYRNQLGLGQKNQCCKHASVRFTRNFCGISTMEFLAKKHINFRGNPKGLPFFYIQ